MTLTKIYECDICKNDDDEDSLLEVRIEGRRLEEDKHAHKECLIKVGLLTEPEPLKIEPNVFLSLAEGATSAAEDKAFLHTEEGPPLTEEEEGDD